MGIHEPFPCLNEVTLTSNWKIIISYDDKVLINYFVIKYKSHITMVTVLSTEELIEAIKNDIRVAEEKLSNVSLSQREVEFFSKTEKSQ